MGSSQSRGPGEARRVGEGVNNLDFLVDVINGWPFFRMHLVLCMHLCKCLNRLILKHAVAGALRNVGRENARADRKRGRRAFSDDDNRCHESGRPSGSKASRNWS